MTDLLYPSLSRGLLAAYCPSKQKRPSYTLIDQSPGNRHGKLTNMDPPTDWLTYGKPGMGLDFNGINNRVEFSPGLSWPNNSNAGVTVSHWVYIRNADKTNQGASFGFGAAASIIRMHCPYAEVVYWDAGNTSTGRVSFSMTGYYDRWVHVCGTSSTSFQGLYFDGKLVASQNSGAALTAVDSGTLYLGSAGTGVFHHKGGLDDLLIYTRPLSQDDVKLLSMRRGIAYETRRSTATARSYVAADITRSETHALGLVSDATYTLITNSISRSANSTIAFSQTASNFLLSDVYQVAQTLGISDTVVVKGYQYPTEVVSFLDAATFRIGLPTAGFFLSHALGIADSFSRTQSYGASDTLAFVDVGAHVTPATDAITFTQTIRISKGRSASDAIVFAQAITSESQFRRAVSHANILSQAVAYYSPSDVCTKSRYSRFEGAGSETGLPAKARAVEDFPVSFESLSGTPAAVSLRSPDMDDKHRLSFERVNRETRGGELNVYRDDVWASTKSLLFTIVGIKTTIFDSLQAFIYATLGQEILFNDWTGVTWRGVLTNPGESASEDKDGYWTLAFEFEGAPYAGPPATQSIAFAQTASFTIV